MQISTALQLSLILLNQKPMFRKLPVNNKSSEKKPVNSIKAEQEGQAKARSMEVDIHATDFPQIRPT